MRPIPTHVSRFRGLRACVSVCVLITTVSPEKSTKSIEMPFGGRLTWPHGTWRSLFKGEGCTLAPTAEYDGSIYAAAAMRAVATTTAGVTCCCLHQERRIKTAACLRYNNGYVRCRSLFTISVVMRIFTWTAGRLSSTSVASGPNN